ncbi:unnamed protein product [Staurois parvus]|uniref:Uncharacterized protein n=1 Tax=Staurois parvus TaxID=386267 RepID=A0ABN9DJ94_9NEOB|nr:unnamed protein product [Staurois parvus]
MSCQSAPGALFALRQGRTDHSSTWALPEGPGLVGDPMRCSWYFFIGFFGCGLSVDEDLGAP